MSSESIVPLYYYTTAKEDYEKSYNNDKYHLSNDRGYKFELICDYAYWLYEMETNIRIWE